MRGVVLVVAALVIVRAAAEEPRPPPVLAPVSPSMAGALRYEGTYLYAGDDAPDQFVHR